MVQLPPLERYLAIDCEMVLTTRHQLARIALVDHRGSVVYHSYVFVHPHNVRDYQTPWSGIRRADLEGAPTYEQVCAAVAPLIRDKILVGHALFNDLSALEHRHTYEDVRDTALYYPLRHRAGCTQDGVFPSLKAMARDILGRDIQDGEHDPVEDARATMALFLSVREEYEHMLAKGGDIAPIPDSYARWYW